MKGFLIILGFTVFLWFGAVTAIQSFKLSIPSSLERLERSYYPLLKGENYAQISRSRFAAGWRS